MSPTGEPGHKNCRLEEFIRWNRIMLEHERAYLSKIMGTQAAFLRKADQEAIVHDITDIDACLTFHKPRVDVNQRAYGGRGAYGNPS